jgi:hypothetical protein
VHPGCADDERADAFPTAPTVTTAGRVLVVQNTGSASFTMLGDTVSPVTAMIATWTGSAWARVLFE